MTDEQAERLKRLKGAKPKPSVELTLPDDFMKAMQTEVKAIGEIVDVAIRDGEKHGEELVERLKELAQHMDLAPYIERLEKVIAQSKPAKTKSVEVSNLTELIDKLSLIERKEQWPKWFSPKLYEQVYSGLGEIRKAVEGQQVKLSQEIGDYVPIRRVVRTGNRLFWDDTAFNQLSTGGGGGVSSTYASGETSSLYYGSTALTPKFAAISETSSGDNEVVAAVVGKKIRALSYVLISNGTVNAKWRSATTDISGLLYLLAATGASIGYSPIGHFETASGQALNLNLSGAIAVGGHITYVEV